MSGVMPDADNRVRNVEVTVPPPSLRLLKGTEYPKKLSMNTLNRHVSNLIVLVANEEKHSEDESLAGSVKLGSGNLAQAGPAAAASVGTL